MPSSIIRACIACSVLVGSIACGTQTCLDLVEEFDQEKNNALVCDPASADPCSDQAPVVIKRVDAGGAVTVEALASNCNHAINAARSLKLHQILTRFHAMGCVAQPVPVCQQIFNVCTQGVTGPTCGP